MTWLLAATEGEEDLVVELGDGLFGELGSTLLVLAIGGLVSYGLHVMTFRLIRRGWTSPYLTQANRLARWPARVATTTVGVRASLELTPLGEPSLGRLATVLVIVIIVAATVTALRLVRAFQTAAIETLELDRRETLLARRRFTQVSVVGRILNVGIIVVGAGSVLMTFERARALGASVLASAGLLGVVAGVAARSTLGNLVAGIQVAFAEPIRIDDVVVVEGEWGWIEEINLTHVVVRIWDKRRLVLPTSYFVETPFVNWTRSATQIIGAVLLHLDPRTDVSALRERFMAVLAEDERWDGEEAALQVVDMTDRTIVVRAIMTAPDAMTLWGLRCDVREQLVAWLAEAQPSALPRTWLATEEP